VSKRARGNQRVAIAIFNMAITSLYALRARLMAYGTSFHFRNWERLYASRGLRQSEISIQHLEKDEAETWT